MSTGIEAIVNSPAPDVCPDCGAKMRRQDRLMETVLREVLHEQSGAVLPVGRGMWYCIACNRDFLELEER
jgi:hypothetical protein